MAVNVINVAVIALLSDADAAEFLKGYSAGNLIFSLTLTMVMSQSALSAGLRKSFLVALCFFAFLFLALGETTWIIGFIYPLSLLLLDYSISQGAAASSHIRFRTAGIASAVVLIFGWGLIAGIEVRTAILISMAFYILFRSDGLTQLKIKKTVPFLASIYLCYSGVLYVLPRIGLSAETLKVWYVCAQVSLVLQLKILDFESRGTASISPAISTVLTLSAIALLLIAQILYPSLVAFSLASAGLVGLFAARRVFVSH